MKNYQNLLLRRMRSLVKSYCNAAKSQIEQEWSTISNIDGEANITDEELTIASDIVARSLCAWGQKAWIAEFGKGSLMDKSSSENPFLDDYLSGKSTTDKEKQFNKARLGHALSVVGRPAGRYKDLDDKEYKSGGNLYGKVIEDVSTSKGYPYAPIRGKHIIKQVIDTDISMLQDEMQDAIGDICLELMREFPKELHIYPKRS